MEREKEGEAALARVVAKAESAQAAAEAEAARLAVELESARRAAEEAEAARERSTVAEIPSDAYTGSNGLGVTTDGYNQGPEGIPHSFWSDDAVAAMMPEGMTPDMVTREAWNAFVNCVSTTAKFAIASDCHHFVGIDLY